MFKPHSPPHSTRGELSAWLEIGPSRIDGRGFFARRDFPADGVIVHSCGRVIDVVLTPLTPEQSRISFQIAPALHFLPEILSESPINGLANINHSCDPNTFVTFDSGSRRLILRAIKSIKPGDELTCDYDVTEATIAHPFSCCCASNKCRRFISGYANS